MWEITHPWWEYIVRGLIVYTAVFVLLRVVGKKQIGEMSPFDLVLLLIISEAVSTSLTGGDTSLTAGLISIATFIVMNYALDVLMFKYKSVEKILDGEAMILVKDGRINEKVRQHEKITFEEIDSALRDHGVTKLSDIKFAVLETNGQISIIEHEPKKPSKDPTLS